MAEVLLMLGTLSLTGCYQAAAEDAVEPVVREVVEGLLAPITAESDEPAQDVGQSE